MNLTNEELRRKLTEGIDSLLARIFLITGENRLLLTALRSYTNVMPTSELEKIQVYLPKGAEMSKVKSEHSHDDAFHCCCDALVTLAVAAAAIHDHSCCEATNSHGSECCNKSLCLVLDAMELHIKTLRGSCQE